MSESGLDACLVESLAQAHALTERRGVVPGLSPNSTRSGLFRRTNSQASGVDTNAAALMTAAFIATPACHCTTIVPKVAIAT